MTNDTGVYPCDEPMATIQRAVDETHSCPNWGELDPNQKQAFLEEYLNDSTLIELIEARDRLQNVHAEHDTTEDVDEMLVPSVEAVQSMIRMYLQSQHSERADVAQPHSFNI